MREMTRRIRLLSVMFTMVAAGSAPGSEVPDAAARRLLDAAGVRGGLLVQVGCGRGELTAALGKAFGGLVEALETSPADVAAARDALQQAGAYGRVTVRRFDGRVLPYVANLVNVLVAPDGAGGVPREEILRVLAPGGVALLGGERLVKPRPAGLDEWTHWLHGPDNNAVSADRQVGIARSLQWTMPPRWARHHNLLPSLSAMVAGGGRLYAILDEGAISVKGPPDRWQLVARDAFNGLLLWKRPMGRWGWRAWSEVEFSGLMRFKAPSQVYRRLVAAGDVLYVTPDFTGPVVCLDGATGREVRRYAGTENASEILHHDGLLAVACNVYKPRPGKALMVVEPQTGKVLWRRGNLAGTTAHGDELSRYTDAYLTAGGERLFCIDGDDIVSFELRTGREAWRRPRPAMKKGIFGHYRFNHGNLCTLVWHDGVLLLGQLRPFKDNLNARQQKSMVLLAMDAATGRELWHRESMSLAHFTPPDVFVTGGLVWTLKMDAVSLLGLDLRSGEVRREYPVKDMLVKHHHRCYRNKATGRYYLAGEEGIEYIDFATGELTVQHWLRGACAYGILPACGLIYLPPHSCGCHRNVKLNGFLAVAPARRIEQLPDARRLEAGPARPGRQRAAAAPPAQDWPMYRHDARRSGCATTTVPARPVPRWTRAVGRDLTAPIVAEGKVFVACRDRCLLRCLDAATGQVSWQRTTMGRLDSPPTFAGGRLFYGTSAGRVVALDAATGVPAWSFTAAPADVSLAAWGRLESPWPVGGSVLVRGEKVYAVAGRSMHLDGGLWAWLLDAATGRILQRCRLAARADGRGELAGAVLPDILVAGDDGAVYMRQMRFADGIASHELVGGTDGRLAANDGGLIDGTWFNSTFWTRGRSKGQMLVFNDRLVCGIQAYRKFITKSYPQDIFTAGEGYRLFAERAGGAPAGAAAAAGEGGKAARRRGAGRGAKAPQTLWQRKIDLRAVGMVLAGEHLCLAGAPDVVDPKDPWGAFAGRRGGRLMVVSTATGEPLSTQDLPAPPVYDGLVAAAGRLYVSLADGTVACFAAP